MALRQILAVCALSTTTLTACGMPNPPNIRKTFAQGIEPLGVEAIYPLRENVRLGQIYLVDEETVSKDNPNVPYVPNDVLVTDAFVPRMESARDDLINKDKRFSCTSGNSLSRLYPGAKDMAQFAQNCTASGQAHDGQNTLPGLILAGMPSYNIASIDTGSLSAGVPTAFDNFLAAVGFRQNEQLNVQPQGVVIATLPEDVFAQTIRDACSHKISPFPSDAAESGLVFAIRDLYNDHLVRQFAAKQKLRFDPALYMIKTVYYLHGLRYVYKNSRAYDALLQASINERLKPGITPPTITPVNVTISTSSNGTSGNEAMKNAQTTIKALDDEINKLDKNIESSNMAGINGQFGHASAAGITLYDLFPRPLAFGYTQISEGLLPTREFKKTVHEKYREYRNRMMHSGIKIIEMQQFSARLANKYLGKGEVEKVYNVKKAYRQFCDDVGV